MAEIQHKNPVTSVRLPEPTRNRIDELAAKWNTSMATIITIAIDRMHREEFPMNQRLMTADERRLYEAVHGVKLQPQTDDEIREAFRRQAAKLNEPEERGLMPGPKTPNNLNYMPPTE